MSFDIRTDDILTNYFLQTRAHTSKKPPKGVKRAPVQQNYFYDVPPLNTFKSSEKAKKLCVYNEPQLAMDLNTSGLGLGTDPVALNKSHDLQGPGSHDLQFGDGSHAQAQALPPNVSEMAAEMAVDVPEDMPDLCDSPGTPETPITMSEQIYKVHNMNCCPANSPNLDDDDNEGGFESVIRHSSVKAKTRFQDLYDAKQKNSSSLQPMFEPTEKIKSTMEILSGGDALLKATFEQVYAKMIIARKDRPSAYLFRDFAGHFSTFLDQYGPGGPYSEHAPPTIGWIIHLVLPWLELDIENGDNDGMFNETTIRVYSEVSSWLEGIVRVFGDSAASELVVENVFDTYLDHMSSIDVDIADIAYHSVKSFVKALKPRTDILCKLFLLRSMVPEFDAPERYALRHNRVKLLNAFVERIDETKSLDCQEDLQANMEDIITELEKCSEKETDQTIYKSLHMTRLYSHDVMEGVMALSDYYDDDMEDMAIKSVSSRSPSTRLSLNITKWSKHNSGSITDKIISPAVKPQCSRIRDRIKSKLKKFFKFRTDKVFSENSTEPRASSRGSIFSSIPKSLSGSVDADKIKAFISNTVI